MGAVWQRFGAEWRARKRSWLGLAVLIGFAAGLALAAWTGARRTETAYPRFISAQRAPDITTGGINGPEEAFLPGIETLKKLPQVAEWVDGYSFPANVRTTAGRLLRFPDLIAGGDETGRAGVVLDRARILNGREPDPNADDEGTVSFAAESADLTVGSVVTLVPDPGLFLGEIAREVPIRIVGIHAASGEFASINGISFPSLRLSPAVIRANLDLLRSTEASNVRTTAFKLKRGAADLAAFRAEANRRGVLVELPLETAEHVAGVQKTMRFESWAQALLAVLIALASIAIFGQSLSRMAFLEASEYPTLRSLGMTRAQLTAVGLMRAVVVGLAGALVAVGIGFLASGLTPMGSARLAEPDPGVVADPLVLGLGAAVVVALVVVVAFWPSIRAASLGGSASGIAEIGGVARRSATASALARTPVPSSATAGVRMAFEAGHGRTAVPVRTTIASVAVGLAALVMALTFRSSLQHLFDSPLLSGYTWDVLAWSHSGAEGVAKLRNDPAVEAADLGGAWNIQIGGSRMLTFVSQPGSSIRPVILEGRTPQSAEEIALGTKTMREAHLRIGDTVEVAPADPTDETSAADLKPVRYRIVGRAIIPQLFFEPHEPGEGAAMTLPAVRRMTAAPDEEIPALVRFRAGVDPTTEMRRLQLAGLRRQQRGDLTTLQGVAAVPLALSAILAAMAAAALVHTLVSTIRRRSRDLAILRTLGFTRRQLRSSVMWQAASLVVVASVVGLPAGVAAGRWLWRLFADQIAVLPQPQVPIGSVLIVAPVTLALALGVALAPARRAARTQPAVVLRTE